MERQRVKEYSHRYFLAPGECTPEGEMPITLLLTRIIEVATEHADIWGVGYSTLITSNESWVLSRVSIEMTKLPPVNKKYIFTTWIESYNRHFSQRNFEISDDEGNILGYARTVWVVINSETRESVDISKFNYMTEVISQHPCPIEPQSRLKPVSDGSVGHYNFKYCDLDINQHVNSVRYVELLMNQLPLSTYHANMVKRFEIAYIRECRYAEDVTIRVDNSTNDVRLEITDADGNSHCRARILLEPRNGNLQ
ncbi:MAG: acyl-[acyl-carrier-protein] thioesterase [Muribaculaceae bacterium]